MAKARKNAEMVQDGLNQAATDTGRSILADGDANPQAPADLISDAPLEYAVTGCARLNLREGPGLDEPIVAVLPCGVGVSNTGETAGGWWEVTTGRLTGWVLSEYLEPVWS